MFCGIQTALTIHVDSGNDLSLLVFKAKVAIEKVSLYAIRRRRFEQSSDAKSSLALHVHVERIHEAHELLFDPSDFCAIAGVQIVRRSGLLKQQFCVMRAQNRVTVQCYPLDDTGEHKRVH